MPLSFVIDKQRRIVISTASGLVTYSEIAAHQVQLKNHPDFDPTFDQLIDATGVTKVSVKVEEIQTVAPAAAFCNWFPPGFRHEQRLCVRYGPDV